MIVVRAPPKQPVPGRRILQQLVCHRREFLEQIRQFHRASSAEPVAKAAS